MITLPQPILVELVERFLVANSPSYLLRYYRANAFVANLGAQMSVSALWNEMDIVDSLGVFTAEDMAVGYAALVALTFKPYNEYSGRLAEKKFSALSWGNKIFDIWNGSQITNNTRTLFIQPPKPVIIVGAGSVGQTVSSLLGSLPPSNAYTNSAIFSIR